MIPEELQVLPQWVGWEKRVRNGRATKVPVSLDTNQPIDITDPANFREYPIDKTNRGFAFTKADPYIGVDLDNCVDETGQLKEWAADIVSELDSYTERSQSGNGVHILLRGSLPANTRKGHIEMYDCDRYFALTGDLYDPYSTEIEDRQQEIDRLYAELCPEDECRPPAVKQEVPVDDEDLLNRIRRSRQGQRFEKLWAGDLSDYDGDHSRADFDLCGILAFWTGNDEPRMDALFRRSGLYRDKWERTDYRDRTLHNALQGEVYKPPKDDDLQVPDHIKGKHNEIAWRTLAQTDLVYMPERDTFFQYGINSKCRGIWEDIGRDGAVLDRIFWPVLLERGEVPKSTILNECTRSLKAQAVAPPDFNRADNLVTFKDCVLDLDSYDEGEFQIYPHMSDNYSTTYVNVNWQEKVVMDIDSMSHCPHFDRLLEHGLNMKNISPKEYAQRRKAVLQMLGYCLLPHNELQRFHMIQGKPRSGKSVLIEVLQQMIPPRFRNSLELSAMSDKFAFASLEEKQLNICSESATNDKVGEDRLKRITGGDTVQIEQKNKPSYETKIPCHFIVVCNEKPKFYDPSGATHKRLEIILWEGDTVPEEDRDRKLFKRIKPEIPWIVRLAMVEIAEVLRTGEWSRSPATLKKLRDYENWCNPVLDFVTECCVLIPDARVCENQLFDAFERYCEETGRLFHKQKPNFGTVLNERFSIERAPRSAHSRHMLAGIQLKPEYEYQLN